MLRFERKLFSCLQGAANDSITIFLPKNAVRKRLQVGESILFVKIDGILFDTGVLFTFFCFSLTNSFSSAMYALNFKNRKPSCWLFLSTRVKYLAQIFFRKIWFIRRTGSEPVCVMVCWLKQSPGSMQCFAHRNSRWGERKQTSKEF